MSEVIYPPDTFYKPVVHNSATPDSFQSRWSQEAINKLIELWPHHTSDQVAKRLAAEFGGVWGGNSVRRKVQRLMLPQKNPAVWSDERTARLKELWANNDLSGAVIAGMLNEEFGTKFTRSAILATVTRLGMTGRKIANRISAEEQRVRRNAAKRDWYARNRDKVISRNQAYKQRVQARIVVPQIDDIAIPQAQRKTLIDLGRHDCRWPVGEPGRSDFFFCGAVVEQDRPYCPSHCGRAYIETRPR